MFCRGKGSHLENGTDVSSLVVPIRVKSKSVAACACRSQLARVGDPLCGSVARDQAALGRVLGALRLDDDTEALAVFLALLGARRFLGLCVVRDAMAIRAFTAIVTLVLSCSAYQS